MTRGSWLAITHIASTTGAAVVSSPVSRWPWYLVHAVSRGLQVASWLENLPADEMPPQEIWHHQKRLDAWFEGVKAERGRRSNPAPGGEQWEDVPGTSTVEFDVDGDVRELRGY